MIEWSNFGLAAWKQEGALDIQNRPSPQVPQPIKFLDASLCKPDIWKLEHQTWTNPVLDVSGIRISTAVPFPRKKKSEEKN